MENTAKISIVADASGVKPGIDTAISEVQGLGAAIAEIAATMRVLTEQMRAGFEQAGASAHSATAATRETGAAAHEAESGFIAMAMGIHEAAESVRTMQMRAKEFAEIFVAIFAVEQIHEFISKMAEAAEKVSHTAEQFGMTVAQVQQLQGVAAATGVSFDALTRGMGLLDKNLVTQAGSTSAAGKALAAMGLDAGDAGDQMKILATVADRFKTMDDGPKKAALAMVLFGKSGRELIPVLNLGAEGIAKLKEKMDEYGATNAEAVAKGKELAESTNEQRIAFMGVSNVMTSAFAPMLKDLTDGMNSLIKQFVQSYTEGGTVKIILEAMVGAFEGLGTIVSAVGAVLKPFGDIIVFVSDHIETFLPIAAAVAALLAGPYVAAAVAATIATISQSVAMGELVTAFAAEGIIGAVSAAFGVFVIAVGDATVATWAFTAALLANPLTWVAAACAAAVGGLVWLAMHVKSTGDAFDVLKDVVLIALEGIKGAIVGTGAIVQAFAKIADDAMHLNWGAIKADWQAGLNGVVAEVKSASDKIKALSDDMMSHLSFGGGPQTKEKTGLEMPKPGGSFDPDLSKTPKAKKGGKDTLVQELNDVLEAKKTAWARQQDAQGTAQGYSLQSEADYWKAILARTDLSAKDRGEIERKYLSARSALLKDAWAKEVDGYKEQIIEAGKNAAEKLVIVNKQVAETKRMYGEDSKEYAAALDVKAAAERAADAQIDEIKKLQSQSAAKRSEDAIAQAEKEAANRVAMGRETAAQLLVEEKKFEDALFAIKRAEQQRELAAGLKANDPIAIAKANAAVEALELAHQDKLTQIDRKAALERTKIQRAAIDSTSKLFSQNLASMLTLQQGFSASISNLYQGMASIVSSALAGIIEKWLTAHLTALIAGGAAEKVSALTQITANAAVAGSAAFASTAAIPIVGPELAPAAGAAAFAGAMSFAPLASAAGGYWQVPDDMLAQIHKDEIVLPAWAANPLRDMVTGGGSWRLPAAISSPLGSSGARTPGPAANDTFGGSGGGSGSQQDVHVHLHVNDTQTGAEFLLRHKETIAKSVDQAVRDGWRSKYRR